MIVLVFILKAKLRFQVYSVVDEMFLAGEIRETSQTKVLKQLLMLTSLEWPCFLRISYWKAVFNKSNKFFECNLLISVYWGELELNVADGGVFTEMSCLFIEIFLIWRL